MNWFVTLLGLFVLQKQEVASLTEASFYSDANYEGDGVVTNDLDAIGFVYMNPEHQNRMSSYKLTAGSCIQYFQATEPNFEGEWGWSMEVEFPDLSQGSSMNDKINSVSACGNYSKTISCPEGTFVKKVMWDKADRLRNGIEISCYLPSSKTPQEVIRSHGSSTLEGNTECVAVRTLKYKVDEGRRAIVENSVECSVPNSAAYDIDWTVWCGDKTAVGGLELVIENRSDFIKEMNVLCQDVKNVEEVCAAHDQSSILFTCDAKDAQFPLKCSHAKTVGYGLTTSFTEELREEYTFNVEFGFDIGYAAFGLSANFRTNLGISSTTGYSWGTTQESSFQTETTITVEAEAPAGCITEVSEIIGECSFMQVRPNYFKRTDKCGNDAFVTNVEAPENFNTSQVFSSKIPEKVLMYLKHSGNKIR